MAFIYLLSNESMPEAVKVGCTTRLPEERALELYTTGVPTPFKVYSYWKVDSEKLLQIEADVHKKLAGYRVHSNREFFKLQPQFATNIISKFLNSYDEIEKEREKEKERARKENERLNKEKQLEQELQAKQQHEEKTIETWEIFKDDLWTGSLKAAEKQLGMSLDSINKNEKDFYDSFRLVILMILWMFSFGLIFMFIGSTLNKILPESKKVKKSKKLRNDLFKIRNAKFIDIRREWFKGHNVIYPFDDSDIE